LSWQECLLASIAALRHVVRDTGKDYTGEAARPRISEADVAWCPNTNGDTQPITITPTRFIGYENSCDIADVTQTSGAYQATLRCQSEGTTSTERVRMAVQGQNLSLTYVDRDNATVQLTKCTTLADTATTAPVP
ncbi:hypothetical protein, partial [Brevundimonas sp.]|uniref:hypothetical protein n=1 Tax=Brevundimonas sp. TaxID=1871086 RepID=UPI002AB91C5D